MINATEARIVTNENLDKAVEKENQKRIELEQKYIKIFNEQVVEPICERIAKRAGEGYSFTNITIGDRTYVYAYINSHIYDDLGHWGGLAYKRTERLTSLIIEWLHKLNYTVDLISINTSDKGYHDIYTLKISW